MRVAIYCRVSSDEQAEHGTSLTNQQEVLRKYAEQHQYTLIGEPYVDDGYSAGTTNRPHFQRLLKDAKLSKFDAVLVTKTDRFARNQGDALYIIDKEFAPHDIQLISVAEPYDHREPTGKLQFGIHAGFAEYERAVIRERTVGGRRRRAAEGKAMHSRMLLGYKKDKEHNWLIDPEGFKLLQKMINWLLVDKLPTTEIARRLNLQGVKAYRGGLWRSSVIGRILNNRAYLGEGHYGTVKYTIPALMDRQMFSQIQAMLLNNRKNGVKAKTHPNPLRLLLVCGICSHRYRLSCSSFGEINYRYFICGNYFKLNDIGERPRQCLTSPLKFEDVIEAVLIRVRRALTSQEFVKELMSDQHQRENGEILSLEAEKTAAEKALREKQVALNKLFDLYGTTKIKPEVLDQQVQRFTKAVEALQASYDSYVNQINQQKRIFSNLKEIKAQIDLIRKRLDHNELSAVEMGELFAKIISSVTVTYNRERQRCAYHIKLKWEELPQIVELDKAKTR